MLGRYLEEAVSNQHFYNIAGMEFKSNSPYLKCRMLLKSTGNATNTKRRAWFSLMRGLPTSNYELALMLAHAFDVWYLILDET